MELVLAIIVGILGLYSFLERPWYGDYPNWGTHHMRKWYNVFGRVYGNVEYQLFGSFWDSFDVSRTFSGLSRIGGRSFC